MQEQVIHDSIEKSVKLANKTRRVPWGLHLELLNRELLPLPEFINKVVNCKDLMIACIVSLIYLTGSRGGEIMRKKFPEKESIKLKDFQMSNNGEYLIITSPVFKLRNSSKIRKNPTLRFKKAYIKLDPSDMYYPLFEIIDKYLDSLTNEEKMNPETPLFKIQYGTLRKNLKKYLNWNPHYIRHLRASHLVQYHNFNDLDLRDFFGWITGDMPTRYTHQSSEQLRKKLFAPPINPYI